MLRVVLAVLLAATLLGIALPVVDSARVAHADSQVRTELDHLDTAATTLRTESDPTDPHIAGASVERTVVLPGATWGTAGIEWVRIPARANHTGIRWRVAGGTTRRVRPDVAVLAPPDGLTLREPGRHRLRLTLEARDGRAVVVVSRVDR